MNTIVKSLAALIVAISAHSAMAEPGKWYIGIGTGQSNYNNWATEPDIAEVMNELGSSLGVVNFDGTQSADDDKRDAGNKLFGGYSFHKNIAVEFSFIDMGEVDANSSASGTFYDAVNNSIDGDLFASTSAKVDAYTLDINLKVPITPVTALIIKAGVYDADIKLKLDSGSSISVEKFSYSKTEDATGRHYGIAINFKITAATGVRAEWERLHSVKANNGISDVELLSAALVYSF